jgi:hypothetical protein
MIAAPEGRRAGGAFEVREDHRATVRDGRQSSVVISTAEFVFFASAVEDSPE